MYALAMVNSLFTCHLSSKFHRIGAHGFKTYLRSSVLKRFGNAQTGRGFCRKHPTSRPLPPYQVRTIVQPPQRFSPKYHEDKVPKEYEMIYQSSVGKRHIKVLYMIGFVFAGYIGLFAYFVFLFRGDWDSSEKFTVPGLNIRVSSLKFTLACALTLFVTVWCLVAAKFSKLPVQRIYESPDKMKYIGILKKTIFSTERVEFTVENVTALPLKAGQILRQGNATICGRHCLIYATDFKSSSYFNKFLGYDPPVNDKSKENNTKQ